MRVQLLNAYTGAESPVGSLRDLLHLFCASVIVASRYKVCETNIFVFVALSGLGGGGRWRACCRRRECVKMGGKCVSIFLCVYVTADDGWAGRTEQGTMNEVTDRDG